MVGRRGRPPKRKVEELQEELDGKSKSSKEARIEAIPLDASEPAHLAVMTLGPGTWRSYESSENCDDHTSTVSEAEEGREGTLSQGTSWKGIPYTLQSQVALSCKRVSNGEAFDCETQTFHFSPASAPKVVVVPDSDTPETIKMEIDTDQQEEFLNHPLVCCVEGCGARSDTDTTSTFYTVPKGQEYPIWLETLDIVPCTDADLRQHVCNKHFITPTKLVFPKGRTRKKKTCDMLVAEEAEKIKQGLSSGRPKRTPKPNKNYDWAEIVPLIKAEPDDLEEDEVSYANSSSALDKLGGSVTKARQLLLSSHKEDKENKRPTSDTEGILGKEGEEEEEEEEEEDLKNISLPSHPRPPPPKPKGRPHRIRDSCTQTERSYKPPGPHLPLREVTVQCSIVAEPPSPCTSCSYVNWLRLEELLVDCATKTEGDLCVPAVQECLRRVVSGAPHPTHATNVLKLLIGEKRDALENTSDIVLVPNQGDEVEIENVIHPVVEEPITGLREIIPKTWQKKAKWKKALKEVEVVNKEEEEEEEEDLDGLGIQEATEMDDEEFHPGYLEGEETEEEEDDQALDDEDWTMSKQDRDSRPGAKKKQKKSQQQARAKKGQTPVAGEGQQGLDPLGMPHTSAGMIRKSKEIKEHHQKDLYRDGGEHQCSDCGEKFNCLLEARVHRQQVHTGPASWHPQHRCPTCEQTFSGKWSLYMHCVLQHGAPRRHQCDQCDYEGPRLYHLKRHMKVHTGERSHVCEVCHKGLKSQQAYRNHMVLHTNKGRYRCDQCDKAFNQRNLYEDHCRTHRAARCFSCKYCGAAFKTYKNVACHVRAVHLGDKRFICDVCGAQHMTGANLRAHLKIHRCASSMPRAFQCDLCSGSFRGLRGLTVHLEVLHGVSEEGPQETGKGAATQHPTRRPQQIEYVVVEDEEAREATGDGNMKGILLHTKKVAVVGDKYRDGDQEENEEEEETKGNEGTMEEQEQEERDGVEDNCPAEEEDGRTVLVESENFVFRVKPEEIEFEI